MALTLQEHQSTQTVPGAWPDNTYLTPTLVMLAMAIITCAADIVMLIVQCTSGDTAKRAIVLASRIQSTGSVLQTIASVGGAGFLKYAKNNSGNRDLWGWSCVSSAPEVSSGMLCNSNVRPLPSYLKACREMLTTLVVRSLVPFNLAGCVASPEYPHYTLRIVETRREE
jgi:hypothetical protein